MTPQERFASARVARLATVSASGQPHLVPVVFALVGQRIYTAVDAKPKRTKALRRLANIAANPRVAVLVDRYDEDWRALWWVRADGVARIAIEPEAREGIAALVERYTQYRAEPPPGPVIAIDVDRWSYWSAKIAGARGYRRHNSDNGAE
jgi:PPOX class probable F420-dependent enzyme